MNVGKPSLKGVKKSGKTSKKRNLEELKPLQLELRENPGLWSPSVDEETQRIFERHEQSLRSLASQMDALIQEAGRRFRQEMMDYWKTQDLDTETRDTSPKKKTKTIHEPESVIQVSEKIVAQEEEIDSRFSLPLQENPDPEMNTRIQELIQEIRRQEDEQNILEEFLETLPAPETPLLQVESTEENPEYKKEENSSTLS